MKLASCVFDELLLNSTSSSIKCHTPSRPNYKYNHSFACPTTYFLLPILTP
uniref:Ovule protein n=1 Tax=Heterorhabditis bacteriophora TaxID=37862 RepID=A0A1I7WVI5_HETBA